jgi:hypothetical protein
MKKTFLAVLALAMMMFSGTINTVHAFTISYNTVLSGATPAGPAPWLTATFTDTNQLVGSTTFSGVLLTVNATGLAGQEFTTDMLFNTTLASLNGLKIINNTPSVANFSSQFGIDSINGAAGGANNKYDLEISFDTSNGPNANRLTDNEIANIFLYNVAGLTADTFNALSVTDGHVSQAHIQGIGQNGNDSSWVIQGDGGGGGSGNPVPEPGTMILLGFGMLSLAIYGKRRMNS